VIEALQPGDVLMVTRLDRLARSTRDLLNTLAAITAKKAGFRSLGDTWADTTTSHGSLMLTVLGGLAVRARPDTKAHRRRTSARRGAWGENGTQAEDDVAPDEGGPTPPRGWRAAARHR
jgi:DNA invertase Pin-like site-specific DNA recombinase